MLGGSCGLEASEIVLTEQRNSEETEDVMASGLSKALSNSGVLNGISEDGIQALFKVSNSLVLKGIILTPWFQEKWVSDDTLPVNPE